LTLSQIAREVGVCKATVSLVLNGKAKQHHISDSTIRTVEDYCRTIKYRPNIHAIRIGRKIVGNVMLLLNTGDRYSRANSFSDYNVAQITGGIAREARTEGCSLAVRVFDEGVSGELVFNSFRNREIDGMIYYGTAVPEDWMRVFREERCKVVGIGIRPQDGISSVNIDNREISRALTAELIAAGRRNFRYFAGPGSSYPGAERYAGFLEALEAAGIPWSGRRCFEADFDENTAFGLTEKLLAGKAAPPDAVVCAKDSMAIGVIRALRRHGVEVPGRVAVAGGVNIMTAGYLSPALTTFENRAEAMGVEAFRLLDRLVRGGSPPRDIVLRSAIVRRASA